MIDIEYKDKGNYKLPTSFAEVTIKQFQQINSLQVEEEIARSIAFIAILTGISKDDILNLPISEFKKIEEKISFIYDDKKADIKAIFEIDGVEYGYRKDLTKMKTSEFIDFDTFLKADNIIDNIHFLMAILYRPLTSKKNNIDYIIEEYDSSTVHDRASVFKEKLTVDIMLSAMVFLKAHILILSEHSLDFLKNQKNPKKRMMSKKKVLTFHKNGAGFFHYLRSLAQTLDFKMLGWHQTY